MNRDIQKKRAEDLLVLHHDPRILVLPNIWDPLGALMLQQNGYSAVATASAAVAYSLGFDDGQNIGLETMISAIERIVDRVDIPVTADMERGYGESPEEVAQNMRRVIDAGAVGINLEDSTVEGGPLSPVYLQCDRIAAVRAMADEAGIPLVINARTDVFLGGVAGTTETRLAEAIHRGEAYMAAGADCFYPILAGDVPTVTSMYEALRCPINVLALAGTAPMKELEAIGIARLSLGPGLIKASLTVMRQIASNLREYGNYDQFTSEAMSGDEMQTYLN